MSDNIDNLAQSFFIVLIFCSVLNDSYSIMNNYFNNEHVQKKMKYYNNVYTVAKNILTKNYESDSDGTIIIDEGVKENIKEDKNKEDKNKEDKNKVDKNKEETSKKENKPDLVEEYIEKNNEVNNNPEIIYKKDHIIVNKIKKEHKELKEHKKNIKEEKVRKIKS